MKKLVIKKTLAFLFILISIFSFGSCGFRYRGEHIDLYTVAVNNIFAAKGYFSNGEASFDPTIEVIERDSYGRVMFFYNEGPLSVFGRALVIMQKSDGDTVYYYQDTCQIPHIYTEYPENYREFKYNEIYSEEEIALLKDVNDWNKPLDLEKCTKAEVSNEKNDEGYLGLEEENFEKYIMEYAKEQGYKGNDGIYRFSYYCNKDIYGREIYYVWGVGRDVKGEGVSPKSESRNFELVMIFNSDKTCSLDNIYEIRDPKECYEAIKALKEKCGWNQPI